MEFQSRSAETQPSVSKGWGKPSLYSARRIGVGLAQSTVRELYGALLHHGADEAWLITTAGFQRSATSFAANKRLRLLTIRQVLEGNELWETPACGR